MAKYGRVEIVVEDPTQKQMIIDFVNREYEDLRAVGNDYLIVNYSSYNFLKRLKDFIGANDMWDVEVSDVFAMERGFDSV